MDKIEAYRRCLILLDEGLQKQSHFSELIFHIFSFSSIFFVRASMVAMLTSFEIISAALPTLADPPTALSCRATYAR